MLYKKAVDQFKEYFQEKKFTAQYETQEILYNYKMDCHSQKYLLKKYNINN